MLGLFQRTVYLNIGQPGQTGTKYQGFKITAVIDFSQSPTPQTAEIRLYNPNADTVGAAYQSGALFQLWAGYAGNTALIFQGTPIKGGVSIEKAGTDRILTLSLRDSNTPYSTQVSIGIVTPTTAGQVVGQILQSGIGLGYLDYDTTRQFPRGFTYAGPLTGAIDRVADLLGLIWYIRDGRLYLHPETGATAEPSPLLSYQAGLIRVARETDGLVAETLIQPGLRPGQRIQLQGVNPLDGIYTIRETKYTLDSHTGPFYARIKAR